MVNEEDTAFSSKKKTQTKRMGNLMQYLEELRSYAYTRGRYYANDYEKYKDKYENCKEFEEGFKDKIIKLFEEEETAKQMCFSLERKKPTLKKKLDSDIIPPSDMFFTRGQLYMLNKIIEEIKQKYGVEE